MHIPLWQLALLSLSQRGYLLAAAAALSIPFDPTSLVQPQNLTSLSPLDYVPSDFTIAIEPVRGPLISLPIACLEAAITVIGQDLGLNDFTGRIPKQHWILNNAVIAVATKLAPSDTIERRFVIWGMFEGLKKMTNEKDFRSAIFSLNWRGSIVGSLAFHPKGSSILDAESDISPTSNDLILSIDSMANGSALSTQSASETKEVTFELHHILPVRPLPELGLFVNLIGVLVKVAEHSASEVVRSQLMIRIDNFGVRIWITGPDGGPPPSRRPFLRYETIMMSITQIPKALAHLESCEAFKLVVSIDEVRVADILAEPFPPRTALAPLNSSRDTAVYAFTAEARSR